MDSNCCPSQALTDMAAERERPNEWDNVRVVTHGGGPQYVACIEEPGQLRPRLVA
jgi:hypothetical protein